MSEFPSSSRKSTGNSSTGSNSRASRSVVGPDTVSEMNIYANGGRVTDNNRTVDGNVKAVRVNGNDVEKKAAVQEIFASVGKCERCDDYSSTKKELRTPN